MPSDLKGHKSKPKKKALPPGLSERDAHILKKVRRRAYHMGTFLLSLPSMNIMLTYLDRSLNCCCCGGRFGWSAVIGIIPVVGDIIDLLIALSVIRLCMQVGLPKHIVSLPILPSPCFSERVRLRKCTPTWRLISALA